MNTLNNQGVQNATANFGFTAQTPIPSSSSKLTYQNIITSPPNNQRGTPNTRHKSIGGLLMSDQTQKQNFIIQKTHTGSTYKQSGTSNTFNNLENMNWVFLKNEQSKLNGLKNSQRKQKSKNKDLSTSFGGLGGSENISIDSPLDKGNTSNGQANDFEEILARHQRQQEPTFEDDVQILNDHQQHYLMNDEDSPDQILEKVAQSVHDQMCPGIGLTLNKINISSVKANDSWDSKQTGGSNQEQNERIPKINGYMAKIKNSSNGSQGSARGGVGGSSSNFQSFKKHAMKLPKVQMRSSLLNQYTNQKTLSVPISPRVFESAKFGSNSLKKSNNDSTLNEVNLSTGNNKDSSQGPNQQFILPQIDKFTQQSTFLETQDQTTQPSLVNGRSNYLRERLERQEFDNNFEYSQENTNIIHDGSNSFITELTKVENNLKNRFTLNNLRKKVIGSPQPHGGSNEIPNKNQSQTGSNGGCNSIDNHRITIIKHSSQNLSKIANMQMNSSSIQVNNSSLSSNSKKLCSTCRKHHSKQFSFESQHIEISSKLHDNNNMSCLSDGAQQQIEEDYELETNKIQLRLNQITERMFSQKRDQEKKRQGNNSFNDYDMSGNQGYNTIRDNKYFNRFSLKYNAQLTQAFEEADKTNSLNSSSNNVTLKNEVLPYMEQHNDIRRQMKEEALKQQQLNATPAQKSGKIMKIHIKKQQLQQMIGKNDNSTEEPNKAKIKLDKMKNYGRYYLKPNEFNRIIQNQIVRKNKESREEEENEDRGGEIIYHKRNSSVL